MKSIHQTGAMTVAGATIINNTLNVGNDVTFEGDNTFNISNSSSNNVFAIDVANTTFALDLDMTVNNSATFKNDFSITNSSNTSLFDVDVANTALTIDLDTTVNNSIMLQMTLLLKTHQTQIYLILMYKYNINNRFRCDIQQHS